MRSALLKARVELVLADLLLKYVVPVEVGQTNRPRVVGETAFGDSDLGEADDVQTL